MRALGTLCPLAWCAVLALFLSRPGSTTLEAQDEVQPPLQVSACQLEYGASGVVVVSWANPEDYEGVILFLDGEPAPGEVDGALGTARVEAAPGSHAFGVQGVVGDATSATRSVNFTVLGATPLAAPITNLDCEFLPEAGGSLRLTWELGSDAWVSGLIEVPGRTGSVAIAAGATQAVIAAGEEEPHVARLTFKNSGGYSSEVFTPVCLPRTPAFRRGDCDASKNVNITDPVFQLNTQFLGAPRWFCDDACDADDNGHIGLADAIYLLQYLFLEGPPPPFPGPSECGIDITDDFLGGTCTCP